MSADLANCRDWLLITADCLTKLLCDKRLNLRRISAQGAANAASLQWPGNNAPYHFVHLLQQQMSRIPTSRAVEGSCYARHCRRRKQTHKFRNDTAPFRLRVKRRFLILQRPDCPGAVVLFESCELSGTSLVDSSSLLCGLE